LERLRDVGATPTLVAQTFAQVHSDTAGDTPLEVANQSEESESQRAEWRQLFADVFGLAPPADGVIAVEPPPEPAPAPVLLGLPPAVDAPEPAGGAAGGATDLNGVAGGPWRLLKCGDLALSCQSASKGSSVSMKPAFNVGCDTALQSWRLTEHGHLQNQVSAPSQYVAASQCDADISDILLVVAERVG